MAVSYVRVVACSYHRFTVCRNVYLMTPAAAPVEDSWIETSLSVVSSSLLWLQKVEADLQLMVTDTVTCVGRSDERTDPAVTADTPRRPRRSLWSRTKTFVGRMFCCGAIDNADIYMSLYGYITIIWALDFRRPLPPPLKSSCRPRS
ncbi:unnamed protein product [Macrosiphum euphorbiae]|uniref:Uncharacterized protein n=1 Tax=Macrosiphum euphorbiae TaxID=13131 RepID=A0AAV0VL23_9HEMI|nr:unnamed protein product [Macrosiphum euphorbiae]